MPFGLVRVISVAWLARSAKPIGGWLCCLGAAMMWTPSCSCRCSVCKRLCSQFVGPHADESRMAELGGRAEFHETHFDYLANKCPGLGFGPQFDPLPVRETGANIAKRGFDEAQAAGVLAAAFAEPGDCD